MNFSEIYGEFDTQYSEIDNFFNQIIEDDNKHASWLNVLSYLEYIGSRKIFKTQKQEDMNEVILRHAADEARHALILKQMIEKLSVSDYGSYDTEHLMKGYSAYRYFQSLDSIVKKSFGNKRKNDREFTHLCYLYVSLIIEIRANWLYDHYSNALTRNNSPVNVSGIINDEIRHLEDTWNEIAKLDTGHLDRIKALSKSENNYFYNWYLNLLKQLSN